MEQEQPQAEKSETVKQLRRNRDFWKDRFSQIEQENQTMGKHFQQLSAELVEARDGLKEAAEKRDLALTLLRELADHVSGRNGMLAKSKSFCGVCQNPNSCPIAKVWKAIDPAEGVAA